MSDEEKKAIAYLKFYIERDVMYEDTHYEQIKTILNLIEKRTKEIEELKEGFKIQEHNYQVAMEEIEQRWEDKIKAKTIEIKNRPVKDKFITASQGKLNTIIDMESLLEKE